ncbi:MAG: isopenicillin N synthase family oxygenase [Bacteroidetes bacterium]|nr:isopenicillin N synthase family oxygenase [Bacteroidota bacterium]
MQSIPLLRLSDFTAGETADKLRFVLNLGEAFHEVGFARISDHGVPELLLRDMYRQTRAFFDLPLEVKKLYINESANGQRGYTPFGREHAKGRLEGDLKEFWHWGPFLPPSEFPHAEPNLEVAELPEYYGLAARMYESLLQCGIQLLRAIAIYLQLPEDYFDEKVKTGNSILRCIHYPALKQEPRDAMRAGEHEDINLITLLPAASAEGLQVLTRAGKWLDAQPAEGELIVNVGDMLQRLTNLKLVSTTHRVVNPPREMWHTPRYSLPFFVHPVPDMSLTCLTSCTDAANPARYSPVTAGQYLAERLREIGLE